MSNLFKGFSWRWICLILHTRIILALFYNATCIFSNLKKNCCIVVIVIIITESTEKNLVGDFNSNKNASIVFNFSFYSFPKKEFF